MRGLVVLALLAGCDALFGFDPVAVIDAPAGARDGSDGAGDGLIAWLPLDETSGTTFADASMHGHTGSCAMPGCPVPAGGRIGGAMRFDGIDDIIQITGTPDLETASGFTVAFWLNVEQYDGCAVGKLLGPLGMTTSNSWQLCVDPQGHLDFYSGGPVLHSAFTVPLNAWHHVALRFDGTNKVLSYDGHDVLEVATSFEFDSGDVTLGADIDNGLVSAALNATLDDVRIYARPLGPDELLNLANP